MNQNEPVASLRTLSANLYDISGFPLASTTSWLAGMVKISKANGAFVNTTNLPTTVTGGADNSFKLQLEIAEVNTLGPLRIQFFDAVGGNLIAEYVDEVIDPLVLGMLVLRQGTAQAGAALSITLDSGASAVNGTYTDAIVYIDGGTGVGQINSGMDYVGATKVLTVAKPWSTNPDNTSTFKLLPGPAALASAKSTLDGVDVEGSYKLSDLIRLLTAINAGKASNYETDGAAFRDLADTKTRATYTYDSTGRPTVVIGDLD